jgi:hypothetical protein
MKLKDIPRLIDHSSVYHVDIEWQYMHENWLKQQAEYGMDLCPDFQRGHVWTTDQQVAYVEFCLRGGQSSRVLLFNQPGIKGPGEIGELLLVDGLQRLTSVTAFLENNLRVFGRLRNEWEDGIRIRNQRWSIFIHELPTRAMCLEWYLQLNSGGTPHAASEIERVRELLKAEQPTTSTEV